jgi:hypothetical protein
VGAQDDGWIHAVYHAERTRHPRPAHNPPVFPVPATDSQRQARRADMHAMDTFRYDIGHCVEAFKHTVLKSLARRCTNSDPNYGTVWFHCRQKPYETPAAVVLNALHILVCEMSAAQPVYVRAVMWYVRRALLRSAAATDAGGKQAGDGPAEGDAARPLGDADPTDPAAAAAAAVEAQQEQHQQEQYQQHRADEGKGKDGADTAARDEELLADFAAVRSVRPRGRI